MSGEDGTEETGTSTTGTSTRGKDRFGTEKGTTATGPPKTATADKKSSDGRALEKFFTFLEQGFRDRRSAPQTLTLPQVLFEAMMSQSDASLDDGLEHGALYGYRSLRSSYGMVLAVGDEEKTVFSKAYTQAKNMRPPLTVVGRFHTHMAAQGVGTEGLTGFQGGGLSSGDLINFWTTKEKSSAVVSYTRQGKRKIYFPLRPTEFRMVKSLEDIANKYQERVIQLVGKGGDPDEVSERELTRLAQNVAFVLYIAVEGRVLSTRR